MNKYIWVFFKMGDEFKNNEIGIIKKDISYKKYSNNFWIFFCNLRNLGNYVNYRQYPLLNAKEIYTVQTIL